VLSLTFAVGELPPTAARGRLVHEWSDETGEVYARAYAGSDLRWIDWSGLAVFAFSRELTTVRAWPAAGADRRLVRETFTRTLQPIVMQAIGWQALHASAIVVAAGVVALCGRSGSGKSTIAYTLGQRFEQWADDGVIIRRSGDGVVARRVPFTPRLRQESRVLLGARPPLSSTPDDVGRELPLVSVAVLKQVPELGATMQSRSLSSSEAFQTLVTHAHCFNPLDADEARRFAEDYLAIAGAVPVVELSYRPGLTNLAAVTAAVLQSVPGHERQVERASTLTRG